MTDPAEITAETTAETADETATSAPAEEVTGESAMEEVD